MANSTDKKKGTRPQLQSVALISTFTFIYLATLAFGLYLFETGYYIPQKSEIVKEKWRLQQYIDHDKASEFQSAGALVAREIIQDGFAPGAAPGRARLDRAMEDLFESSPPVVEAAVIDMDGNVLVQYFRPDRLRTQQNFTNSLLSRGFQVTAQNSVTPPSRTGRSIAVLRMAVTTAIGDRDIEALTAKWRTRMIIFAVLVTAAYFFILRYIVSPLGRVLRYLENKTSGRSEIIPAPRSQLERAYNNLARDATLTRFSKELRDLIALEGISHVDPVLSRVPELVERLLLIEGCQVWTFSRSVEEGRWVVERVYTRQYPWLEVGAFEKQVDARLLSHQPDRSRDAWAGVMLPPVREGGSPSFCDILTETHDRVSVFMVHPGPAQRDITAWWKDYYARVVVELRYGIDSIEEQRRMILAEKSKANISLSRNLGHDLTNIIATSKLELMNVQAFLSLKPEDVANSPKKQKLFQESLQALLNNTRFLQEIVNLYRSFSYLQKPKFEEVNLSDLVRDVTVLYQLSLSKRMRVETRLDESVPPIIVEPRLLRLALFNILTNASDAMKRSAASDNPEGIITITTRLDRERRFTEITVEDTGPGLCDKDGHLLNNDQLSEIFQLGYTTKANQEGEGLGLNWVQTIVHEFHGGEIVAANRPEGGAAFTIRLPESHISPARPASASRSPIPESHNLQEV